MKTTFQMLVLAGMLGLTFPLSAQTNPGAASLPFSLNSQGSATLPSGVAVHRFSSIPTTRTVSPATGDLPNQGSSPSSATGGWYHLGADGIGLLASGTNPAGAVIVAINTTGQTNITVSWDCKTILNQSSRDNSIALQYRVGTSGNFTNVGSTSTYSSAGQSNGHTSGTFSETLPAGAENQAVVQVRWIYWESGSVSGSRDKISVDNISITASAGCGNPANLAVSNIGTNGADLDWDAVSGAGSYEYAVSNSATPPSSGTTVGTNSHTAGGLLSSTLYYFHVRSNCSGTFSGWSSISFETEDSASEEENDTFTVMTYNLLNYPGSTGATRDPSFRTVIQDVQPDILVVQELATTAGATTFLNNVMNYSSSVYSLGTVIDGPDSDNGIYYKTAKFQFISNTPIATALRDINEFRIRHIASGDTLIFYSAHLKSSDTPTDEALRAAEVDSLRKRTNALPAGRYFMVCGDFNIYGSSEAAYQKLIQNGSNANGRFNDLVSMSGTWNNASYAIHHTQSPRTTSFGGGATGGMDDRFDMILFSNAITTSGGFDIVNSSYKAYGNDGAHYNAALNTPPYTLYSSTIASALHDVSDHLPVVVKLYYDFSSPATQGNSGTMEKNASKALHLYPNPASGEFVLQLNQELNEKLELDLFDAAGRKVHSFTIDQPVNGEKYKLDLSSLGLAAGTYYLKSLGIIHPVVLR